MSNTTIITILYLLLVHWIADFIFQTHEMSLKKSKSNWWLSYHVSIYSLITLILWLPICGYNNKYNNTNISVLDWGIIFPITFITHWITDYFTSRWTSKLYAKGDIHNFFVVVGLDQLIHFTTLFLTLKYIIQ